MPSQFQTAHAVNAIRQGGIIAYATEAVYGLGCDPDNIPAIQRILQLKGRSPLQGLILIASNLEQLEPYLDELSDSENKAIKTYWPGPTTLILPASNNTSDWLTGGRNSIAVRISAHADVHKLCNALGHPLVSTSANRSGQAPCKYTWQLAKTFGEDLDYVFPSTLGTQNKPSEIRIAENGQLIRSA